MPGKSRRQRGVHEVQHLRRRTQLCVQRADFRPCQRGALCSPSSRTAMTRQSRAQAPSCDASWPQETRESPGPSYFPCGTRGHVHPRRAAAAADGALRNTRGSALVLALQPSPEFPGGLSTSDRGPTLLPPRRLSVKGTGSSRASCLALVFLVHDRHGPDPETTGRPRTPPFRGGDRRREQPCDA